MKKDQINKFVVILFGIIILPVLFIVIFSAQAINFFNGNQDNNQTTPLSAYATEEECIEMETSNCVSVITTEGQELWIGE